MSLTQLYSRYRKRVAPSILHLLNTQVEKLSSEDQWLKRYSMAIPLWFQGVFDTVGALGVPFGNIPIISRSNYGFLETDLRINDSRAYHAIAVDEHREAFAPTLWTKSVTEGVASPEPRQLEDVEQRWFVGAHADVGGGYTDGLLAQVPLVWLMQKAQLHGLTFKGSAVIDGDENKAAIHDSFGDMAGGLYRACKLFQPFYRTIGGAPVVKDKTTTTTINETIDVSVFDRWQKDVNYRPANLIDWATRHHVEMGAIHDTVRADNLTVIPPTASP